ncbi:unnamed protein product [Ambrosiozyma monospora]|uniref:Unnamed protein product n=1 Tax=Ambrosiozyma monospora TaxID=43982 RepID=A0A9W6Z4D0_AMBMO|nr:unnamed protein product [Ambrosiozyma monospora]
MSTLLLNQQKNKDPANITFDDITGEHNYKKYTFMSIFRYISMLVSIVFQIGFLVSDVYTLIQIYALGHWGDNYAIKYVPIRVYQIVFTICIGISLLYMVITYIMGTVIAGRYMIVSSYLNNIAKQIHSLRSYERFCIFSRISSGSFHNWVALTIYGSYHYDIICWLLADTPRQLLNGTTIAYSITNSFSSINIVVIIKAIYVTDEKEAILLSFMTFSFIVWCFFTLKHIIVIFTSMCFIPSCKSKSGKSFQDYCYLIVANSVMEMYDKEEKKMTNMMKRKRKVPSFIKKDESDIYSTSFEMENSTPETTCSTSGTLKRQQQQPYGAPSLSHAQTLDSFQSNRERMGLAQPAGTYHSAGEAYANPFDDGAGSIYTEKQVPYPARKGSNDTRFNNDGIYRTDTRGTGASGVNPFDDRYMNNQNSNQNLLLSQNTAGTGYSNNVPGGGYPVYHSNAPTPAGYQANGPSAGYVPPPQQGIQNSSPLIYGRNGTYASGREDYARNDSIPTVTDPYPASRNDSLPMADPFNTRNDSAPFSFN